MDILQVDRWWRRLGRGLLVPRCLLCSERGINGCDLCAKCRDCLPWNRSACPRCGLPLPLPDECGECLVRPPPVAHTVAAFVYGFPLDRLVPRFKFHHDLAAGRLMAQLMAGPLAAAPRPEALVPVPLHAGRLRQRGYDQALELAKPLARSLGLPLRAGLLRRVRATAPQSELDATARQRNMARAFAVEMEYPLPVHVALVDDVMTTGATLHAAAKALKKAGVARVDAWVCARVP
ncbi:ComF family protein [Pseudoxanthomonas putridarboris]|uniref:ComF family protein n=1 Tax=Pseudoxanthomonas putridarboris TaxID=752605 RepID=A0ABU9J3P5_9GAMM